MPNHDRFEDVYPGTPLSMTVAASAATVIDNEYACHHRFDYDWACIDIKPHPTKFTFIMRIPLHGHRPDCSGSPEPTNDSVDQSASTSNTPEEPSSKRIKLGSSELEIHKQQSSRQTALLAQVPSRSKNQAEYFAEWNAWAQTGRIPGENRREAVKLRNNLKLPLDTPDMRFLGVSWVTNDDLTTAEQNVKALENQEFVHYLSTHWEPWQSVVSRLHGMQHKQAQE